MKRQTFVQTAAVDAWQGESGIKFLWITQCVKRHVSGDWGDVDDEDRATNEAGKDTGGMLMSVWPIPEPFRDGERKLWIITDPGHEVTTILFPSDY